MKKKEDEGYGPSEDCEDKEPDDSPTNTGATHSH